MTVIVLGGVLYPSDLVTSFVEVTVIVFGGEGLFPADLVTSFVDVTVTVTG